jgi:hypothetical protein
MVIFQDYCRGCGHLLERNGPFLQVDSKRSDLDFENRFC